MNTQEKLAVIREACVAANPEKVWNEENPYEHGRFKSGIDVPARLADVLLAVNAAGKPCYIHSSQQFYRKGGDYLGNWNLRSDDLVAQNPETIDFLYDLLKTNPT